MKVTELSDGLYTEIRTEKGNIYVSLEYKKVPMTVANFIGLAEGTLNREDEGVPFYDGLNFHRVIDNFMIQGGCPLGTGTGGPGYHFPDEFDLNLRHSGPGVLSMANSGPGTNGSQFFITHVETPWLDDKHTVFGRVIEGMDVVNSIQQGDRIEKVTIIRKGSDAENFVVTRGSFDSLLNGALGAATEKARKEAMKTAASIEEKWPEAVKTDSGLRYIVLKEGSGDVNPSMGQTVTVHYTGSLIDGTVFDSSVKRGQPAEFAVGQVIEGWNEALKMMRKGEKRTLIIPPELGYGKKGYPGVIPPDSYLVFDVELLDF